MEPSQKGEQTKDTQKQSDNRHTCHIQPDSLCALVLHCAHLIPALLIEASLPMAQCQESCHLHQASFIAAGVLSGFLSRGIA